MRSLRRDADRICRRFGLRCTALDPERANVKSRYGICYDDGSIKIRLRHVYTGEPLKYSSLVNTLCHELAHLKHFNHGPQFQAFYAKLLSWARQEGIYRPGARPAPSRALEQPAAGQPRMDFGPSSRPAPPRPASERVIARGTAVQDRTADTARPSAPMTRPVQLDLFA